MDSKNNSYLYTLTVTHRLMYPLENIFKPWSNQPLYLWNQNQFYKYTVLEVIFTFTSTQL